MIVHDSSKSQFGLNPLSCFRFSEAAIEALHLNDLSKLTDKLVQDSIRDNKLNMSSFFEEVDMKIHRSHLLQAFLFDHIQPHLPSFNTQVLNLGTQNSFFTHYVYKASEQSQHLLEEMARIEEKNKKMVKKHTKAVQHAV